MADLSVKVRIVDLPMFKKHLLDLSLGVAILQHLTMRIDSANLTDPQDISREIRRALAAMDGRDG